MSQFGQITIVMLFAFAMVIAQTQSPDEQVCQVAHCSTCEDSTTCKECEQFFALYHGQCVWCPSDPSTDNPQTCSLCDNSCLNCDVFKSQCVQCLPGFQLLEMPNSSKKCEPCHIHNCAICPNLNDCAACEPGYMFDKVSLTCLRCQVDSCLQCENDTTSCEACDSGFIYSSLANECRNTNLECDKGYYYSIGERGCQQCPDGCSSCSNPKQCFECNSGFYRPMVQSNSYLTTCYQCADTCKECKYNANFCTSCLTTVTQPFYGDCDSKCHDGYYMSQSSQQCRMCPPTCKKCSSSSHCTACQYPGVYILEDDMCVRACPSGQYEYFDALNQLVKTQMADTPTSYIDIVTNLFENYRTEDLTQGLKCKACDPSCGECLFQPTYCISCLSSILDIATQVCQPNCVEGQYQSYSWNYDIAVCRKCESPCTTCSSESVCLTCEDPYEPVNGICQHGGVSNAVNGQCTGTQYFFDNLCFTKCPSGLIQQEQPASCLCSVDCKRCIYDVYHDQTSCQACMNKENYIYNEKCIAACPAGTFTFDTDPVEDFTNNAQGICYDSCPAKMFTSENFCVTECHEGSRSFRQHCVQQICSAGFYEDSLIVARMAQDLSNPKIDTSGICKPCPENCGQCNSKECDVCLEGYLLDVEANLCVKQCQPWQSVQQLGDLQAQCITCTWGCAQCKKGMFLDNSNCYPACMEDCGDGVNTTIHVDGVGSQLGYLSRTEPIHLTWSIKQHLPEQNVSVSNVTCNVTGYDLTRDRINLRMSFTFKQFPITVNYNDSLSQEFQFPKGQFGDNTVVNASCFSLMYMGAWKVHLIQLQFKTFPLPKGTMRVRMTSPSQFLFTLDGFNPQFEHLNDPVFSSPNSQESYLPYQFVLYAENVCTQAHLRLKVPVWDFTSQEPLYNNTHLYSVEVSEDSCYRFTLHVFNAWTTGTTIYSNIFNVYPVGNAASVDYYVSKLINPTPKELKYVLQQTTIKFDLMRSNYCAYGKLKQDLQECGCLNDGNIQYVSHVENATQVTLNILQDVLQGHDEALDVVTSILLYYTNNTCALQSKSLIYTISQLIDRITQNYTLNAKIAGHLLLSAINIQNSLKSSAIHRMLTRLPADPITLNSRPQLNPLPVIKEGPIPGDLAVNVQASLDAALKRYALLTNYSSVIHGGMHLVVQQLQYKKTSYFKISIGKIDVELPFTSIQRVYKMGDDTYSLVARLQSSVSNTRGVKLLNNQSIDLQMFTAKQGLLFDKWDPQFSVWLSFKDESLSGFEKCVAFDTFWSVRGLTTKGTKGVIQCKADILSTFSVNTVLPEPLAILKTRKTNEEVGQINLVVMVVFFIVFTSFGWFWQHVTESPSLNKVKQKPSITAADEVEIKFTEVAKPQMQRRNSIEVEEDDEQKHPRRQNQAIANPGPLFVEYEGQSQQHIIIKPMPAEVTSTFILHIDKAEAGLRVAVIFLWISSYQWIFAVLLQAPRLSEDSEDVFYQAATITFLLAIPITYIYSLMVYAVIRCVCATDNKTSCKFILVTILFILNLVWTLVACFNLTQERLPLFHAMNMVIQVILNMGLLDYIMDNVAQSWKRIHMMRKFKIMEF